MRKFLITLWEIYRLAVGAAVIVLLLLHFILSPQRHGSQAAPPTSARAVNPEGEQAPSGVDSTPRER
jgi:hypothetical protein